MRTRKPFTEAVQSLLAMQFELCILSDRIDKTLAADRCRTRCQVIAWPYPAA